MSYSLQLYAGDLSLSGPGGYAVVTGENKMVQDLRSWFLEPQGTDPSHPDYGSSLAAGVDPQGHEVGVLGGLLTQELIATVHAETYRILHAYQLQQQIRLENETVLLSGKNTFTPGEVLVAINGVSVSQRGDVLVIQPYLRAGAGNEVVLTQAF